MFCFVFECSESFLSIKELFRDVEFFRGLILFHLNVKPFFLLKNSKVSLQGFHRNFLSIIFVVCESNVNQKSTFHLFTLIYIFNYQTWEAFLESSCRDKTPIESMFYPKRQNYMNLVGNTVDEFKNHLRIYFIGHFILHAFLENASQKR